MQRRRRQQQQRQQQQQRRQRRQLVAAAGHDEGRFDQSYFGAATEISFWISSGKILLDGIRTGLQKVTLTFIHIYVTEHYHSTALQ